MNQLVSTEWLEKNIDKVKILDASWHLPNSNRVPKNEFKLCHIKNSNFFDIDEYSNKESKLPHMLPSKERWEEIVSNLGINNDDHIVVYDNSAVLSACRVWYSFLYFGHNDNLISVLDGGLKKWLSEKRYVTNEVSKFLSSNYKATANSSLVINKIQVEENIISKKFQLIDARSEKRFFGLEPELRKELKSGNILNSKNLPFQFMINEDNTFKNKQDLQNIFKDKEINFDKELAFTCGSGVTACILGLANSIISGKKPIIYDGSWAEYGLKNK